MKRGTNCRFSLPLFLALLLFGVYSCQKTDAPSPDPEIQSKAKPHPAKPSAENAAVVYEWYRFMNTLQRPVAPQPPVITQHRAFAYIGVGLFESVQPGIKGGSSFDAKLYQMPSMPKPSKPKDYLWSASANAAMASLCKFFLASLSPVDRAAIDAKEASIYAQLKLLAPEDVLKRSEEFGRSIATAIYNWSTTDNFTLASPGYVPLGANWSWEPTPPNFAAPVGSNLQYARPFLKYSLHATAPPPPVVYSEEENSAFYRAALEVYHLGGATTVTPSNRATANWWADAGGPGTGLPAPYHILSIVTSVLESQNAGLWKAAEVYAKTGIGLKDGPINTFRAKYQYNLLRPITYIRRHINGNWLSLLINPPYPDYPSGLVSNYGPIIQVLVKEFGDIPVTDDAYGWNGVPPRHYSALSHLLAEASVSRVYGGIHYRFTQDASVEMGIKLGNEIDKIRVVGPEYE